MDEDFKQDSTLHTLNRDSKEFDQKNMNSPFLDKKFLGIKSYNEDTSKSNYIDNIQQLSKTLTDSNNHMGYNLMEYDSLISEPNKDEQESTQNISTLNFRKSNDITNLIENIPDDVIRQLKEV